MEHDCPGRPGIQLYIRRRRRSEFQRRGSANLSRSVAADIAVNRDISAVRPEKPGRRCYAIAVKDLVVNDIAVDDQSASSGCLERAGVGDGVRSGIDIEDIGTG